MTTISDDETLVTLGVDTHVDVHTAAVLDAVGKTIATATFPATRSGYEDLLVTTR